MQIFIDNPDIKRELVRIKTFAINNPFDLTNGIPRTHIPAGDNPKHVLINGTMGIVYSVEKQPPGLCHHLSVSKMGNQPPHPAIVDYVLSMFGMSKLKVELINKWTSITST